MHCCSFRKIFSDLLLFLLYSVVFMLFYFFGSFRVSCFSFCFHFKRTEAREMHKIPFRQFAFIMGTRARRGRKPKQSKKKRSDFLFHIIFSLRRIQSLEARSLCIENRIVSFIIIFMQISIFYSIECQQSQFK